MVSPVIDHVGGTQICTFESVGQRTHFYKKGIDTPHGSPLYLTMIAENKAGLQTVIRADPRFVDMTPPIVCCLQVLEIN